MNSESEDQRSAVPRNGALNQVSPGDSAGAAGAVHSLQWEDATAGIWAPVVPLLQELLEPPLPRERQAQEPVQWEPQAPALQARSDARESSPPASLELVRASSAMLRAVPWESEWSSERKKTRHPRALEDATAVASAAEWDGKALPPDAAQIPPSSLLR